MSQDLNDYLTGEERRQMDALLKKAECRKQEKEGEGKSQQVMFMECQIGCVQENGKEQTQQRDNFSCDLEHLLGQICEFSKKYNVCPKYCEDELPFP